MIFAYADPPYIGQARKRYGCEEIDHHGLIDRLTNEFPDGWALSCSTPTLGFILTLCPSDVRIGAWVKPFAVFRPNVNPAYTWEPVVFRGGRKRDRTFTTIKDHVIESITMKKGLCGAKPERFCNWILDLLGFQSGDQMVDLYPGTGVMERVLLARTGGEA